MGLAVKIFDRTEKEYIGIVYGTFTEQQPKFNGIVLGSWITYRRNQVEKQNQDGVYLLTTQGFVKYHNERFPQWKIEVIHEDQIIYVDSH